MNELWFIRCVGWGKGRSEGWIIGLGLGNSGGDKKSYCLDRECIFFEVFVCLGIVIVVCRLILII